MFLCKFKKMILSRKIRPVFNNIENDFWFKKKIKSILYVKKIRSVFNENTHQFCG